jgi:hypothetical protein
MENLLLIYLFQLMCQYNIILIYKELAELYKIWKIVTVNLINSYFNNINSFVIYNFNNKKNKGS